MDTAIVITRQLKRAQQQAQARVLTLGIVHATKTALTRAPASGLGDDGVQPRLKLAASQSPPHHPAPTAARARAGRLRTGSLLRALTESD